MAVAILPDGLKSERLPEFRRPVVSRMDGHETAEAPSVLQQSQRQHMADAATAHVRTNVKAPHPQGCRDGRFEGHAPDTHECLVHKSTQQPFAVTRKPVVANRPFIDKTGKMEMAFLPGFARKPRDLTGQFIAENADIDCHGDANASRPQVLESRAASPRPACRPARR
ncbi:UNVERIFIED_ORG: hypothetical protein GGD43_005047 [Rhizobium esperanzae]